MIVSKHSGQSLVDYLIILIFISLIVSTNYQAVGVKVLNLYKTVEIKYSNAVNPVSPTAVNT